MAEFPICSIENCGKPIVNKRGWCNAHYLRWLRYGDPLGKSIREPERYLQDVVLPYDGDECLDWPFARAGKGYAQISREGKHFYVHRLVCAEAHGPAPTPEHQAAHSCGRGYSGCVTKRHLSWKTQEENEADKISHGTYQFGQLNPAVKLSEEQVMQIRSLRGIVSQSAIGRAFGVSQSTVKDIQLRKTWSWLP